MQCEPDYLHLVTFYDGELQLHWLHVLRMDPTSSMSGDNLVDEKYNDFLLVNPASQTCMHVISSVMEACAH